MGSLRGLQDYSGSTIRAPSEGCTVNQEHDFHLYNEKPTEHLFELHSIVRKSAIVFVILCITWSFMVDQLISSWLDYSPLPAGPNNENLSLFAPFDWIQIRWSLVMLLSLVSIMPFLSIMTYNFAKPGLFSRERNWLTVVLFLTTTIVPVSILIIWIIGIPALFDISLSHGTPDGVLVRYDASSIFSIGLGVTWILVVWSVTTMILSLSRVFGMVYSGKTRFRNRILAISSGSLILSLPVEYDGLRLLIAFLIAISSEAVSRTAPVKMDLWDPSKNFDSTN